MAVSSTAKSKRIAVLILTVLLPIMLIVTGCGQKKELTTQEYYDQLYDNFKQYIADLQEIDGIQTSVSTVNELQDQLQKATEICEKAEKTLDNFIKMAPPSRFADKHKTLVSAVELEKKFVKAAQKIFTAKTADELEQYKNEAESIFADVPNEQQFTGVLAKLLPEVKAAVDD